MQNPGLDESQAGIKIAGRNINNLRYADDTTFMVESQEELKNLLMRVKETKEPLMRVKEESEKAGLKLKIQKAKTMTFSPITSWQIGEKWKKWKISYSRSAKSLHGDCSHEIRGFRKQSIRKQRHHFADKDPYSQNYHFPSSCVWM